MSTSTTDSRRRERIEFRATVEEKRLIECAATAVDATLTGFALDSLTDAAKRVLADRTQFVLSPEAQAAWDELNERPARDLQGLQALMARPSPFSDE